MKAIKIICGILAPVFLWATSSASADMVRVTSGTVQVIPSEYLTNMTLTVVGPNGFSTSDYSKNGTPRVSLAFDGQIADGTYRWELTGMTRKPIARPSNMLDDGRGPEARRKQHYEKSSSSGMFVIRRGALLEAAPVEEITLGTE